jgi:hypothetical protein
MIRTLATTMTVLAAIGAVVIGQAQKPMSPDGVAQAQVGALPFAVEQLTWSFVDMTTAGGKVALMWGKTMASTPFTASN